MSNIEHPEESGRFMFRVDFHREMLRAVPAYCFSIRNADGSGAEFLGLVDLLNDNAAFVFGSDVIRDMLRDNVDQHAGWLMDIMDGEREVCSIVFPFSSQDRMRA